MSAQGPIPFPGYQLKVVTTYPRRLYYRIRKLLKPRMSLSVGPAVLEVDLRDEGLTRSLYFDGEYEATFQRLAEQMDLQGCTCIDVGANIGVHTLHLSSLVGARGTVIAIEPDRENFALLQANIEANGISNVLLVNAAAGTVTGRASLERSSSNYGDHRVVRGTPAQEGVDVIVLDELVANLTPRRIGFIKIDVQGFETFVVRGLRRTIQANGDVIVLLELSPRSLHLAGSSVSELLRLVDDLDLRGWEIGDLRAMPIASAAEYEERLRDDEEHLILSRDPDRLSRILAAHYGAAFEPGGTV